MDKPSPSIQNTVIFLTSCGKAHDCFRKICIHSLATTASLSFVHVVIYFTMCLFALYTWIFAPRCWHPVVIIKLLIPPTPAFFSSVFFSPCRHLAIKHLTPHSPATRPVFGLNPKAFSPPVSCCNKADKKHTHTHKLPTLSLMQFKETWPRVLEYTVMLLLQWRRILLSSSRISTLLMSFYNSCHIIWVIESIADMFPVCCWKLKNSNDWKACICIKKQTNKQKNQYCDFNSGHFLLVNSRYVDMG